MQTKSNHLSNLEGIKSVFLKDIKATTTGGLIAHNLVPHLASLELAFALYNIGNYDLDDVIQQLETRDVPLPLPYTFEISALSKMTGELIRAIRANSTRVRKYFILCLHHQFPPWESQLLCERMQARERYKNRYCSEANNFELYPTSRKVVRGIMYYHNLPLETAPRIRSWVYTLLLQATRCTTYFISSAALWKRVQHIHYTNGALNTVTFKPFISQYILHGFHTGFYSSSTDSEHHERNHHMLVCSTNFKDNT